MIDPRNIRRIAGSLGDWKLQEITVTPAQALLFNIRQAYQGTQERSIIVGNYWVLSHREHGCVMSNTPAEIADHEEFFSKAKGNVLLNGLGLGMAAEVVASKREVETVTVVEKDADVIKLIAASLPNKIKIINEDAFDFTPGTRYDCVWNDIWPDISSNNLPEMAILKKKYRNNAVWQGFWCKDNCLWMQSIENQIKHRK